MGSSSTTSTVLMLPASVYASSALNDLTVAVRVSYGQPGEILGVSSPSRMLGHPLLRFDGGRLTQERIPSSKQVLVGEVGGAYLLQGHACGPGGQYSHRPLHPHRARHLDLETHVLELRDAEDRLNVGLAHVLVRRVRVFGESPGRQHRRQLAAHVLDPLPDRLLLGEGRPIKTNSSRAAAPVTTSRLNNEPASIRSSAPARPANAGRGLSPLSVACPRLPANATIIKRMGGRRRFARGTMPRTKDSAGSGGPAGRPSPDHPTIACTSYPGSKTSRLILVVQATAGIGG